MSIVCSSCGSKIPFIGNVCPKCYANKGHDKAWFGLFFVIGIPLFLIGGALGGFVGTVAGLILAMVVTHKIVGTGSQRQPAPSRDDKDRHSPG